MRKHDIPGKRISALFICPSRKKFWVVPRTTVRVHILTYATDRPTNAHTYWLTIPPRFNASPPALANRIEDKLSCICHELIAISVQCSIPMTQCGKLKHKPDDRNIIHMNHIFFFFPSVHRHNGNLCALLIIPAREMLTNSVGRLG